MTSEIGHMIEVKAEIEREKAEIGKGRVETETETVVERKDRG